MMSKRKGILTVLLSSAAVVLLQGTASAVTLPTSGFAYDVYDIAVNKIVMGPIGIAGIVGSIAYAAYSTVTARALPAILGVVGAALIAGARTISTSLGAII